MALLAQAVLIHTMFPKLFFFLIYIPQFPTTLPGSVTCAQDTLPTNDYITTLFKT